MLILFNSQDAQSTGLFKNVLQNIIIDNYFMRKPLVLLLLLTSSLTHFSAVSTVRFSFSTFCDTVCLPWHQSLWTLSGCTGACYTRPWGQPQSTGIWPTSRLASTGGIFPVGCEKENKTVMSHDSFQLASPFILRYSFIGPVPSPAWKVLFSRLNLCCGFSAFVFCR